MARRGILAALIAALGAVPWAAAATLPAGFHETLVASGLNKPTAMAIAPDGRVFIAEQGGALRVVESDALVTDAFVTISVNSSGERGLLGVAFDPDFAAATNKYVYVYYTTSTAPIHNRVSRFTATGNTGGGELPILNLENLSATNHNGGAIHFGPDGKLYVAVGENAVSSNSQTLSNRLGKILRINSDGTIPTDNPYYGTAMGDNRSIWALGLRNPFTFSFQHGTGRMFINDVGETNWEEINQGIAGANYGWPDCEGDCTTPHPTFEDPVYQYGHSGIPESTGCAIVGSAFYNPATAQFPADYVGDYFFGDLCTGFIRRFDPVLNQDYDFALGIDDLVDLAVSDNGSLYYLARGPGPGATGVLYKITGGTTLARVWGFRAVRRGSDVVLRWSAGGDPRVLGFDVYRGTKRLNPGLLTATGRCCVVVDRRAGHGARTYRLEVVLADGSRYAASRVSVPRS
jgi:glucose/arabinose dehydrogenase